MNTKKSNDFYRKIIKLIIPIVIQNILSTAISSADILMLTCVSDKAISAVSLASQYANILFSVFFGLGTGVTMLCAQYYGKGDLKAIEIIQGIALRFSMICGTTFCLLALTIPQYMMRIFTPSPEIISIGATYLRFMSIAYFSWGIIEVYLSVLRSCGHVTICTVLSSFTFLLNIALNAVFIFGLFGAPKLGAMGVAIATSSSRLIQLLGCFVISHFQKEVKLRFRAMFVKNPLLFQDFIKLSLPALGNDVVWGIAFSGYSAIIGHLNADAVAANSLVVIARNFGTILCFGVASAGTILLGNTLGENLLDKAREDAKRMLKLTVISGFVGGILILLGSPFLIKYASTSLNETALHYLKVMLFINSYYVMGAAVNTTLIAGVFRAGGDSRFGLICDFIDMWLYAIPVGILSAFVFKLPVLVVYFLLCTDEFVKWPWVFKHYKSEKWLNNITRDNVAN